MANTLTNLIADAYVALDVVSRELSGFIPSVGRDSRADAVATGQTLRSHVAPANTAGADFTAAMALPSAAYQTVANKSLTITKNRYFPFSWTGEEEYAMDKGGPGYLNIKQDQIAQAIRAAINEIEADIWTAAYKGASRAYGTAGTTPFATAGDYSDSAQVRKILDDNGAPGDRSLILSTAAGASIRGKQGQVHQYGDAVLLRQGVILDQSGFAIRESAQVAAVTKGTGASYQTNNASGYSIGDTTIAVDTGSGTILAGDTVTFTGDTNIYVVTTALSGGSFTIAAPGLRKALADNVAVTVGNNNTPSVAFSRNAIVLATRLPIIPNEGDLGQHEVITDDRTGISMMLSTYPGMGMNTYMVQVAWGVTVFKPEHVAVLLG